VLEVKNLYKRFGGLTVISDLNLSVAEGELRCIIGPNGAGKTTLFNLISGRLRPDRGRILFEGTDISGDSVHKIARMGIGRKFQSPAVFDQLSVWDNLAVAGHGHSSNLNLFTTRASPALYQRTEEILQATRLERHRDWMAGTLSHGEKQWLEIGMMMLNDPRLGLLDEPTAGMTLAETAQTAELIRQVFRGRTAIIIEHDISFVRRLDTTVSVLHRGSVMREGRFRDIAADPVVRSVYLGEEA
jgi:urea transport system ATP-binding protein